MRVLFVTSPGLGHNFPLVPLSWALRAAGHDVLWSSSVDVPGQAGMPSVDPAPGTDWAEVFQGFFARHPDQQPPTGSDDDRYDFVGALFADVSGYAVDGTVALARRWRPDLVVYSPLQGAGPLAAAAVGVPAVLHAFSPATDTPEFGAAVAAHLADAYERHGAAPAPPAAVLSVTPPSLGGVTDGGWPMRYVPYNGGARVPEWLGGVEDGKPRIAVTLGSVVPGMSGTGALSGLLAAAGEVDAEFVFALGGADVGPLPPNARTVEWLPLSVLLPGCTAVVHHGGSGTTMTALDAGLPQVVLPHGADQHVNATLLRDVGCGTVADAEDLTAERITAVLADTGLREAARRVAADLRVMPAPADLVPRLTELT